PVMIIGHQKGRETKEKIRRNFGMPAPEGYRKALRLMEMAERFYGRKSWLAEIIRFINDILLSAPSIVVGLFVYTIVVAQMQHFS
ncbi:hypothetical protein ONJ17_26960, partial [Salmonella enterica subsp. enterica serovar Agona]|nr:hypothetical protein [Salmonella enterica subsp. enterica serovar Agona]